jgi:hypothetical protein
MNSGDPQRFQRAALKVEVLAVNPRRLNKIGGTAI